MEPFVLKKNPIPHLALESWEKRVPNLSVGFTTRNGGQSKEAYHSMNLALHVGDSQEDVIANRKLLAESLQFPFDSWISADQVHGNHIEIINLDKKGRGRLEQADAVKSTDGIVTNQTNILLTSFYADCVPLFFLDSKNNVVGLAHAGWKGTVLKIAEKMIYTMVSSFQSNREDIQVAIGPSIDQCCYEVNDVVIVPLRESISSIPDEAIIDKKNEHYDLDLKKINKQILIDAGISEKNIEISLYCTSCNTDLFYSHRKENGKTGRMSSWIGIRKDE